MTREPAVLQLTGSLSAAGVAVPVRLRHASRLSVFVGFPGGERFAPGAVFEHLTVNAGGKDLVLSRCELQAAPGVEGVAGRLVFLDDVYDWEVLFAEGRVKNLLGLFSELPLVLGQRAQIRPEFATFVAELNYDLTVYRKFFNEQDRLLANEPTSVAAASQAVVLARARKVLFGYLDSQLQRLEALVKDFTPEEHERHGFYFRQQLWSFLMGSAFMKRTNLKPRGYAGDAAMMEMLYDNAYVGHFVFNKLMHKHPVEHAAAQAVRNRRVLVPRMLREVYARAAPGRFRVASVACGPARELEDIFQAPEDFERIAVTLLDQDDEALAAAKALLTRLGGEGRRVSASFVTESVRTILKTRDLSERLGHFDFIYSMGLFDYLTPPVARRVLERLYELLAPGGVIIVGNYHAENPSRYYMAYWLDWILYYRTEEEMMAMTAELPGARAAVSFDDSRSQMFLRVEKP